MVPTSEKERQGILVIRVWTDHESSGPPRARITSLTDISSDEHLTTAAAGVQSIIDAVRAWLDEFLGG